MEEEGVLMEKIVRYSQKDGYTPATLDPELNLEGDNTLKSELKKLGYEYEHTTGNDCGFGYTLFSKPEKEDYLLTLDMPAYCWNLVRVEGRGDLLCLELTLAKLVLASEITNTLIDLLEHQKKVL